MSTSGRPRVAEPLSSSDVRWLVAEIDDEGLRARLAPYIDADMLSRALDAACGISGWGNRYRPLGATAMVCELEIHGLPKSALAQGAEQHVDMEAVAAAALTRAVALHRIALPVDVGHDAWVDWDSEKLQPLYWPDPSDALDLPDAPEPSEPREPPHARESASPQDSAASAAASEQAPPPLQAAAAKPLGTPPEALDQAPIRSEGQRAIDKLVDRLRDAGLGLDAAKLVNQHQGYGSDPDAARELYTRLRQLLLDRSAS